VIVSNSHGRGNKSASSLMSTTITAGISIVVNDKIIIIFLFKTMTRKTNWWKCKKRDLALFVQRGILDDILYIVFYWMRKILVPKVNVGKKESDMNFC
jgi:hypothetical protein